MRRIGASRIFPLSGNSVENGYLELDEQGFIMRIGEFHGIADRSTGEFYEGILVPGFVNAHCHLELSHLKGRISRDGGMGHFIGEINRLRMGAEEEIVRAAVEAEREMYRQGIVAAGDIVNSPVTINVKKTGNIEWLTLVETFGFHPSRAEKAIGEARRILALFREAGLSATIVPHSPYSVSNELFTKIRELSGTECTLLSLHNQESQAELQFFLNGNGPIREHITGNLGLDASHWKPSGKSSLETILSLLPGKIPLLLVHNTFTAKEDVRLLKQTASDRNVWLVLCPNSNLYIEKALPPVELFRKEKMNICIGTDSLASNGGLSVLSEIKTIHFHFPFIPLEELFTWACLNGAAALGMNDRYGSLETGKKPGILLISPVDLKNGRLTPHTTVQRLA